MPVTPPVLRGAFYSTPFYQRCPEYHPCNRCLMCEKYNPHSAMCRACESIKTDGHHHRCTDAQQAALVQLEEHMRSPAFDPNRKPGTVTLAETGDNRERQRLTEELYQQVKEDIRG